MKKSIIFLINGLGIEKPNSYSISLDQCMPNLRRVKETSFFTTAIINSLEYKGAYQSFFLGDTYKNEINYLRKNVINDDLVKNPVFQSLISFTNNKDTKLHIFIEPTDDNLADLLNKMISLFNMDSTKKVYVHIVLSHQTVGDYDSIISTVNYIKLHSNYNINLGFIFGKESISDVPTKEEIDYYKKLFFMCSAERWTDEAKKLLDLKNSNIRPCKVMGFCTNNDCYFENNDTILFFNTRRENYDSLISVIYNNAANYFKDTVNIVSFSVVKLYSNYNILSFIENINYDASLSNIITKINKKVLIITDKENINLINFYANGLNTVNNPNIIFMIKDQNLFNKDYLFRLVNESDYDLIIFDYYMDFSSTINHLKDYLTKLDTIIGYLSDITMNKHSLFITSLFGAKVEVPVADYNDEKVIIDYEMQIPIFFYDYTYPASKYMLVPGETNDILLSALNCISNDKSIYTLIKEKGILNNIFKSFK